MGALRRTFNPSKVAAASTPFSLSRDKSAPRGAPKAAGSRETRRHAALRVFPFLRVLCVSERPGWSRGGYGTPHQGKHLPSQQA